VPLGMLAEDSIYTRDSTLRADSMEWSQMAFKENKCKYADEEEEVSTATSKKRWAFNNDNDSDNDSSL
jgi:hypothetical protein